MPKVSEIAASQAREAEEQIVEQSKRIDFYLTEYSVELLAQKMRSGAFVVAWVPAGIHLGAGT